MDMGRTIHRENGICQPLFVSFWLEYEVQGKIIDMTKVSSMRACGKF